MKQVYLKQLLHSYFKEKQKYGISTCSMNDVRIVEFDTLQEMSDYFDAMVVDEFTDVMFVFSNGVVTEVPEDVMQIL
jgi:hypothetical protein